MSKPIYYIRLIDQKGTHYYLAASNRSQATYRFTTELNNVVKTWKYRRLADTLVAMMTEQLTVCCDLHNKWEEYEEANKNINFGRNQNPEKPKVSRFTIQIPNIGTLRTDHELNSFSRGGYAQGSYQHTPVITFDSFINGLEVCEATMEDVLGAFDFRSPSTIMEIRIMKNSASYCPVCGINFSNVPYIQLGSKQTSRVCALCIEDATARLKDEYTKIPEGLRLAATRSRLIKKLNKG